MTGGAGFIGSHLTEKLVELKHDAVILDDFSAGLYSNLAGVRRKKVELVKGTVTSPEIVDYATIGVDLIFHLAAKTNVDESLSFPHLFDEVNSSGTLNVLEAARKRDIPCVFMSTSEVYGSALSVPMNESHPLNPQSPYAASKVAAERYCYSYVCSYGMKISIIRSFNNYGPRQKGNVRYGGLIASNIIRVLSGKAPVVRGGTQVRDYLYVGDTVEALVRCLSRGNHSAEPMNIGTGEGHSAKQIIQDIMELTKIRRQATGKPARSGDVQKLICDATRAKEKLGWVPRVPFRQGLETTIGWYTENLKTFEDYIFPSFKQSL